MDTSIRSIYNIVKNKYLIATVLFAVIILFTDHNNIFEQLKRNGELSELQAKKAYYLQEIEQTKKALSDLRNNPAAIEKFARENYMMKRDNEDIFITGDQESIPKK